jgi:Tol biopolymer transport system component
MAETRADLSSRLLLGVLSSVVALSAASCMAQAERPLTPPNEPPPPWQLWKINADGTGFALFAETPGYVCGSPDWSPDGRFVAYDTWRVGQKLTDAHVAVIRADGTDRRLLGPGAMPSWSPDGTQLVFHTYDNPQTIVIMNADGSGRETIMNHWGSPRWLPRGNRIASCLDGNIGLFDLATGRERMILPSRFSVRQGFAISPNGLQFFFGGTSGGVGLATLDERTMMATVRTIGSLRICRHASWSPDGKRVVFAWDVGPQNHVQLYVVDVDGDAIPKLLPGQDPSRRNVNPDWSPDGNTIIFVSQPIAPKSAGER